MDRRTIMMGIGIGVVIGAIVGLIGAMLDLPVSVRGGLTGALVVVGFMTLHRYSNRARSANR